MIIYPSAFCFDLQLSSGDYSEQMMPSLKQKKCMWRTMSIEHLPQAFPLAFSIHVGCPEKWAIEFMLSKVITVTFLQFWGSFCFLLRAFWFSLFIAHDFPAVIALNCEANVKFLSCAVESRQVAAGTAHLPQSATDSDEFINISVLP